MNTIETTADLAHAVDRLVGADERLAKVFDTVGLPPLRRRPPGFKSLMEIVTGQQLSKASAAAIWARVAADLSPVTAKNFAALDDDRFMAAGLSRPKIKTFRAISEAVVDQRLNLSGFDGLDDEEVKAALVAVKGIGPWTAEVYLLSALGRPDIWPAGDLALQVGVHGTHFPPFEPGGSVVGGITALHDTHGMCRSGFEIQDQWGAADKITTNDHSRGARAARRAAVPGGRTGRRAAVRGRRGRDRDDPGARGSNRRDPRDRLAPPTARH